MTEEDIRLMELDPTAMAEGAEVARADIAAGRLTYRWRGHAGPWGHWIVIQLAERFGVGVSDGFGVCFTSPQETAFDRGYNAVLAAEVDRRHGEGLFEAVFRESRQQSQETLWAARRAWFARHPVAKRLSSKM